MRSKMLPLAAALAATTLMIASTSNLAGAAKSAKAPATPAATTKPADAKAPAAPDAAMMAEMMKMSMPGPGHEVLKGMVGTYKAVAKSWFAPGEPEVNEGVSENTLILDGRFLKQDFKGTMMGMPFTGMGVTGYDNQNKTYSTFWVDNMGTYMTIGSGALNEAGNELVTKSTMQGMDGKPQATRHVVKIVNPGQHVFSMYGAQPDGQEKLMLEITYTKI